MAFFPVLLNYIWMLVKLIMFSAVLALPTIGLIYLLKPIFCKLNKKSSFVVSLFLSIFFVVYFVCLLLYFIPVLGKFSQFTFLEAVGFILFQLARLILVCALFSAVLLVIGMFVSLIYDKLAKHDKLTKPKTKKHKKKLSFFVLWESITIVFVVVFAFILLVFPKLPAIVLYLLYM